MRTEADDKIIGKKVRVKQCEPLGRLSDQTYMLEHNPNCPSPYLIRLIGKGAGRIDREPPEKTRDILGYGKTLDAAVSAALHAKDTA